MNKRIIIVWFDNDFLEDSLTGKDIHKWHYIFKGKNKVFLDKYVEEFSLLHNEWWIFFDDIFKTIQEWIKSTNNIENIYKHRDWWIIDCYSLLPKRVSKFLEGLSGSLLICKIDDNEYSYLLDFFNVKKVYLDNEREVINYLKRIR